MRAKKGQYIRVKEELIKDYETRGYVHNLGGYEVTNLEPAGVFIKEFGYIILHSDYEIVEEPEHVLVTGGRVMGRLIDAGLVLDNLSGRLESMKDYDAVKDVINNMPTAYNVDNVVEELKDSSKIYCEEYNQRDGNLYLLDAIEIVEGGGVNG